MRRYNTAGTYVRPPPTKLGGIVPFSKLFDSDSALHRINRGMPYSNDAPTGYQSKTFSRQ